MSEVSELLRMKNKRIDDLKSVIAKKDLLDRLTDNRDFNELIVNGFMVTDAASFVRESADPTISKEAREDALAVAQAAGHLKRYFTAIDNKALVARNELNNIEAEFSSQYEHLASRYGVD